MDIDDIKLSDLKGNLDVTIAFEQKETPITTEQAIHKMAEDVIAGTYGSGTDRKNNLYTAIQTEVNNILKES